MCLPCRKRRGPDFSSEYKLSRERRDVVEGSAIINRDRYMRTIILVFPARSGEPELAMSAFKPFRPKQQSDRSSHACDQPIWGGSDNQRRSVFPQPLNDRRVCFDNRDVPFCGDDVSKAERTRPSLDLVGIL